ncbi:MAG: GNAT family N-acetyltransferase [Nodularia sp. CChRGM 3473]
MSKINIAPFDPSIHAELLRQWLYRPHVVEWWGNPEGNFHEAIQVLPTTQQALIVFDNQPVGYLRWELWTDSQLQEIGLSGVSSSVDIDIFIGERSLIGQGIGTVALRSLLLLLAATTSAPIASICTSIKNGIALRAYEKAGFRRILQYSDFECGLCWLLTAPLR